MTMFEEMQKTQQAAEKYLKGLGNKFKKDNAGKSVVVFPYIKRHEVVDDPVKATEITARPEYQKETSFLFNL